MNEHVDPLFRAQNYQSLTREQRGVPTWESRLKGVERALNADAAQISVANPALLEVAQKLPIVRPGGTTPVVSGVTEP